MKVNLQASQMMKEKTRKKINLKLKKTLSQPGLTRLNHDLEYEIRITLHKRKRKGS
jgi:hypothetical protein